MKIDPKDWRTWGKVGKRAPCPCGSGQQYKVCCRPARKAGGRHGMGPGSPRPYRTADGEEAAVVSEEAWKSLLTTRAKEGAAIANKAMEEIQDRCKKALSSKKLEDKSHHLWRIQSVYEQAMREIMGLPTVRGGKR